MRVATFVLAAALSNLVASAIVAEEINLENYTCEQFLSDTQNVSDGGALLRSMMVISWSTGYIAAHDSGSPRSDAQGMQIIAAAIGDLCSATKSATVVAEVVRKMRDLSQSSRDTASSSPNFITRDNTDIEGDILGNSINMTAESCRDACVADTACKGYSFSKWHKICSLKSRVVRTRLEPSAITGTRLGDEPAPISNATKQMFRLRNTAFPYTGQDANKVDNLEECEKSCEKDDACVAFTFFKDARYCRMMTATDAHSPSTTSDSGIKKQAPQQ